MSKEAGSSCMTGDFKGEQCIIIHLDKKLGGTETSCKVGKYISTSLLLI